MRSSRPSERESILGRRGLGVQLVHCAPQDTEGRKVVGTILAADAFVPMRRLARAGGEDHVLQHDRAVLRQGRQRYRGEGFRRSHSEITFLPEVVEDLHVRCRCYLEPKKKRDAEGKFCGR